MLRSKIAFLWLLAAPLRAVIPLPVADLLQHNAHYFNLENKRVMFQPIGDARYKVTTSETRTALRQGPAVNRPEPGKFSSRLPLKFTFPFAGKRWNQVFINWNGNLTFDGPESAEYPERYTWADGTMRSLASIHETEAIAGRQHMIAPLWGLNAFQGTHIFVYSSASELIVTWDSIRYQSINEAYAPLGRSNFQVRLKRDGSIEFRYQRVDEKDGVVGIFVGAAKNGKLLDGADLPDAQGQASVEDLGAVLHFALKLAKTLTPKHGDSYKVLLHSKNEGMGLIFIQNEEGTHAECFGYLVDGNHGTPTDCPVNSHIQGSGNTVDFYVPKLGLKDPTFFTWKVESSQGSVPSRDVKLTADTRPNFSLGKREYAGNIYEVFHYPSVPKSRHAALKNIYGRVTPNDDFAIVFTDFRIDDIHNHGASNSNEGDGNLFASKTLKQAAGPIYLGPRFSQNMMDATHSYCNYAFGIGWMAHEMTHYWVATLRLKGPEPMLLLDPPNHYHWSMMLATPVVAPVSHLFASPPYDEESAMVEWLSKTRLTVSIRGQLHLGVRPLVCLRSTSILWA